MTSTSRTRRAALALPLALLLAGCAGGSGAGTAGAAPDTAAAVVSPGATLIGRLGTPQDPDAFEISLTADGAPVRTLPAGTYSIQVIDGTGIHNFHLSGPGVDMATSVGNNERPTWQVTFAPGTYEYVCDPHSSSMSGEFTVT